MTKPRPCGCKGCRTCLICETQYDAERYKVQLEFDKDKSYVYCPFCNKAWPGWDFNVFKQHPEHVGTPIEYPGVYIEMDFISEDEEATLMKNIDEVPWDISQSGRRKQNYGPKTNFKKMKAAVGSFDGFPEFSKFLQDRFETVDILRSYDVIEQCSLEYDPSKGASIDPHIDDCWIWGERIITVNCLSDSVLTMTRYHGDTKKYNLHCAEKYCPIVKPDGKINADCQELDKTAFEANKSQSDLDVVVRIPMPRRSLLVIYGEPRYHWEHCVLREDITSRRVCIAYREFTPPYMRNGCHQEIGDQVRRAKSYWDHRKRYLHCKQVYDGLVDGAVGVDLARLKAVARPESGAWLHALPLPQLGTLLDTDSMRIAVALRLGCKVCEAHRCGCGVMVEENGHHGLSCQRCAGRFPRHHALNDIVRRAMVAANVPCVLEPPGLCRTDGKRPDGLTLVPWRRGRCLLWDATCVSTFAASHLRQTMKEAGSAAETAAKAKHVKYSALKPMYDFVPVAVETAGPWSAEALSLFRDLGRRLLDRGCDPRSGSWLVQQMSIAIQRGNAAGIMGTFQPGAIQGGGENV